MTRIVRERLVFALVAVLLAVTGLISASCGVTAKVGTKDEVKKALEDAGFTISEGKLAPVDIFSMVEAGLLTNANYQNAGAAYYVPMLPAVEGQAPAYFSDAPIVPADKGLFIDYRLRPDEAIVMFGKTPPECRYFGYDAGLAARVSPVTGEPVRVFGNYGDPINPMTIKTDGPQDDPYVRNTMIIMTPDKGVDSRIKSAVEKAGYPDGIVNDYPTPSGVLKLGLDAGSDTLLLLHRFAYPVDEKAGKDYDENPTMSVFRATPKTPPEKDPFEIPDGRVRGSGDFSELEMSHSFAQLREAILKKYDGYTAQEFMTTPWMGGADGFDGLVGMQELQPFYGPGRDALYLRSEEFTLADDPDEFVVMYGVNRAETGKATYTSFSVYGSEQHNGVASSFDGQYAGTAEEFLPGNPDAENLYVWKIARSQIDDKTAVVPFDKGVYGVDLDKVMFLGYRSYLEPKTKTGPIASEVIMDRAIKFKKAQ